MMVLAKKEDPRMEHPDMTRNELESQWREAKECFDEALAQKVEVDRIYVAAANRLNTLERLVKKVEKQEMLARQQAAKLRTRKT